MNRSSPGNGRPYRRRLARTGGLAEVPDGGGVTGSWWSSSSFPHEPLRFRKQNSAFATEFSLAIRPSPRFRHGFSEALPFGNLLLALLVCLRPRFLPRLSFLPLLPCHFALFLKWLWTRSSLPSVYISGSLWFRRPLFQHGDSVRVGLQAGLWRRFGQLVGGTLLLSFAFVDRLARRCCFGVFACLELRILLLDLGLVDEALFDLFNYVRISTCGDAVLCANTANSVVPP